MKIEDNRPVVMVLTVVGVLLLFGSKPLMIAIGLKPPILIAAIAFGTAIGLIFVIVGVVSFFQKKSQR